MKSSHRLLLPAVVVLAFIALAADMCGNISTAQEKKAGPQSATTNFLTGTYRTKETPDDALARKVLAATAHLEPAEREGQSRALIRILRSAPLFAIEQYGTTITFNYPDGTRTPFEADGRPRLFRATGNERVNVRAELAGFRLTIDLIWSGGERLRLIYEKPPANEKIIFTRIASNSTVPVPVSAVSEYEKVSPKAIRRFTAMVMQ